MAVRKINFLSLQKSELEYEVGLRGETPADNVADLRKQITKISKELPSEEILASHLSSADDLDGISAALNKSNKNLELLKSKFDRGVYLRTEVILNHVFHRLGRVDAAEDALLLGALAECKRGLRAQDRELSTLKPRETPVSGANAGDPLLPGPSTSSREQVNATESIINVTIDRALSDFTKLKFNGKTCVVSFIQKVDEFVTARGIDYSRVLSFGYEIFTDDALYWFRCARPKVNTWGELVALLKADFLPKNYDSQFKSDIRARTQGVNEPIAIYLSVMEVMFSRLTKPISEEDKLEILLTNIRPCYANALTPSSVINSIDDLKAICQHVEKIQCQVANFVEPSASNMSNLATEFVYRGATSTPVVNKPFTKTNKSFVSAVNNDNIYCPRCRSNTHNLKNCTQPRTIVCFKCGKDGVRTPECPDCNKPTNQKN